MISVSGHIQVVVFSVLSPAVRSQGSGGGRISEEATDGAQLVEAIASAIDAPAKKV
jgi:hypothetical protein